LRERFSGSQREEVNGMSLWKQLFDKPVFVLTSDQDWTPSWAAAELLDLVRHYKLPLHFFRTNPCPVIDQEAAAGKLTQGWHPNFMPGSSHGTGVEEVIHYMKSTFPGSRSARSHVYADSSVISSKLVAAGIIADSQLCTLYQTDLVPILHCTGMIRYPLFFEDDVFFGEHEDGLNLAEVLKHLFTPGLKILNFHSTFVACNTPSQSWYDGRRSIIFGSDSQADDAKFKGRGTTDIFRELVEAILDGGHKFVSFEDLIDRTLVHIEENRGDFPVSVANRVERLRHLDHLPEFHE
jgi:hypothetical protein